MMQTRGFWALFLCAAILLGGTVRGLGSVGGLQASKQKPTPGLEAAKTLSLVTGVAISPLLGVGAVGAYTWWGTPEHDRTRLDWYAQPWFWAPALFLVTIIGLKDIFGAAAPTALKKPFDVAEAVENKVSALVAAGAFLPLIISVFPEAAGGGPEALQHSPFSASFAAIDAGTVGNMLLFPFALAVFVVVFLASNAVNVLILLSPFTTLDTLLKSIRIGLLSILAGGAFANPYIGAALSIVVIVFAYFIAGWSFRLTVMGTVFIWDSLTCRSHRFQPGTESNKMFLARAMDEAPVRTYGALIRGNNGALEFGYRPWMILPKRRFTLPAGAYVVGRGLLYPEIALVENERLQTRLLLSPRYAGHEEALARAYAFGPVRDVGIRKGMKAAWQWLRDLYYGQLAGQPLEPRKTASRGLTVSE